MGAASAHGSRTARGMRVAAISRNKTGPGSIGPHAACGTRRHSKDRRPWVFLPRCYKFLRDRVERLFPCNALPARVLVKPLFRIGPFYRVEDPVRIVPVHYAGDALGAEPSLGAFVAPGNALGGNRFPVEDPYPVGTLVVTEGADTVDPVVFLPVSTTEKFSVALSVLRDDIRHKFNSPLFILCPYVYSCSCS